VSLVDELRMALIRNGSDFSIRQNATEFRQLSEFLSMFDVFDPFRDACLRSAERFSANFTIERSWPLHFLNEVKVALEKETAIVAPFPKAVVEPVLAEARGHLYIRRLHQEMATFNAVPINSKSFLGFRLLTSLVFDAVDADLARKFMQSCAADTALRDWTRVPQLNLVLYYG
jgi:hypothetical protein